MPEFVVFWGLSSWRQALCFSLGHRVPSTHRYLVFPPHRHAWSSRGTSRASPTSQPPTSNLKARRTCGASWCSPAGTSQMSPTQRSPTSRTKKTIRTVSTWMPRASTPTPAARPRTARRSSPPLSISPPVLWLTFWETGVKTWARPSSARRHPRLSWARKVLSPRVGAGYRLCYTLLGK